MPASAKRIAERRRIFRTLHLYGLGYSLDEIGRRTRQKPSTVERVLRLGGVDVDEARARDRSS